MKVILIEVTKSDIENGQMGDAGSCAIALACSRLGFANPCVNDEEIRIECGKTGEAYIAPMPKRAKKFINRFDDDKNSVRPFKFKIKAQAQP